MFTAGEVSSFARNQLSWRMAGRHQRDPLYGPPHRSDGWRRLTFDLGAAAEVIDQSMPSTAAARPWRRQWAGCRSVIRDTNSRHRSEYARRQIDEVPRKRELTAHHLPEIIRADARYWYSRRAVQQVRDDFKHSTVTRGISTIMTAV